MILDDKAADSRLNSPDNLMNRLKAIKEKASPSVVLPPASQEKKEALPFKKSSRSSPALIPAIPPTAEDLIDNLEAKILYGQAHEQALNLLVNSLGRLNERIEEVEKPEKLSSLAIDMSKILSSIKEAQSDHNRDGNKVQINIYAPQFREVHEYETIQLTE